MRKKIKQAEIVQRFARALRQQRLARGMTQQDLATASDVHFTYIGRLEHGLVAPGLDILDRIATALGTTAAALIGDAAQADPLPTLRERARQRFESLVKRGDAHSLSLATAIMTLIDQSHRR